MARETIAGLGGKTVMLRPDVVAQVDELAEAVNLIGSQGLLKGGPDRAGVIAAVVELVLQDRVLVKRLKDSVEPLVVERLERAQAKIERRLRSGGKRGRPKKQALDALLARAQQK